MLYYKEMKQQAYEKIFFYKDTFYVIDVKKLDFTLEILKTNKQKFFEIGNLKGFFQEYNLLCEEFLDFISTSKVVLNGKTQRQNQPILH